MSHRTPSTLSVLHRVKLAVTLPSSRKPMYWVVECVCGWSSPLCDTASRANDLYAEHKGDGSALGVCGELAELLFDGEPVFAGCADDLLERLQAIGECPSLRSTLPELTDR